MFDFLCIFSNKCFAFSENGWYNSLRTSDSSEERIMPGKITNKQKEILEYIKEQILAKGYPPALRDICEAVHLRSTSSVHAHLETLEQNGYIRRDPTKPRAIEILDDNFNLTRREVVNVPVVGTVAAGQPLLAVENIENYFPLPAEYIPKEQSFMLKVKGNSMINAHILDGDYILVRKQNFCDEGDIIAALIDDEATVKRFGKKNGSPYLFPENDNYSPIPFNKEGCKILGKVVGLHRYSIN